MTPTDLKQIQGYMFQTGSNHPAVKIIKRFLNSSPNTSTDILKADNLFDADTEKSLTNFQRNKGLNPTGKMNTKTWLAIGAEMDQISINLVSITDQTVRELLQMGHRSKFPFKKVESAESSGAGISGFVQNKSLNLNDQSVTGDFSFTVYVVVFAPFDWFGPLNLSRGDGKSRRFGFDPFESYRLRADSKMTASPGNHKYPWSVTKSAAATDSYLMIPSGIPVMPGVNIPSVRLRTKKSEGTISEEDTGEEKPEGLYREGNSVRYHFHGNDDAFALWGDNSLLTSDIDVHANIYFEYDYYSKPNSFLMKIGGKITGDQFPAVETYVRDRAGNGVMLGVWQVREGDGPVLTRSGGRGIIGDKKLPMIDIDVSIIVKNGFFTGVLKNGNTISPTEHNKQFTDLPTVKFGGFRRGLFPVLPVFPRPILFP